MNARLSLPLIAALVALMLTALVTPAARASSDPAASGDALATLRAAEEAYDDGMQLLRSDPAEARRRFTESATLYAAVRDSGADNAALHFNLGNALLQANQLGPAIASYLRAERASPGDSRVQRNLAHARGQVTDRFERAGTTTILENVASWWHVLSTSQRLAIAAGAWALLWTLILIRMVRPRLFISEGSAMAFRIGGGTLAAVALTLGVTVAADLALERLRPRGVIVENGVVVRKGNGDGFDPQFQESLGEGVEFRVVDRRPGWLQIELSNGRGGWIRESEAEVL
ncbi:MAG: tetratricopeptide repeat protein [Phycisphaeraceae bacterium]|nr:tetratricopeptide repeat protein [Phycisphaeraceae bacterium]